MDTSQRSFFNPPYQGDLWWMTIAILSALGVFCILFELRKRRRLGVQINSRGVVVAVMMALWFVYISASQILAHHCVVRLMPIQSPTECMHVDVK